MLMYVYAHFITKVVAVMYMVAVLVPEVHLSSIRNPSENQMVKTIK